MGGKIGQTMLKTFSIENIYSSNYLSIMKSVGDSFRTTIGRAILLPLQILIGAVQFIRGFIEGFT